MNELDTIRTEYIESLKQRLKKRKYKFIDTTKINIESLTFVAKHEHWLFPNYHFFFVAEYKYLDFSSLMKFSSSCSQYLLDTVKLSILGQKWIFSVNAIVTNEVDPLFDKDIQKSSHTQYRDIPDPLRINDFPIAIEMRNTKWFHTPMRVVQDGFLHTVGGDAYYDQPNNYFEKGMDEILLPIVPIANEGKT